MTIVLKACGTCACPPSDCGSLSGTAAFQFFVSGWEEDGCGSIPPGNSVFFLLQQVDTILVTVDIGPNIGIPAICGPIVDLGGLGLWRQWTVIMPVGSIEDCSNAQPIGYDSLGNSILSTFPGGGDSDVPCVACTRDCTTAGVQEVFFPSSPSFPVDWVVNVSIPTGFVYVIILDTNGGTNGAVICGSPVSGDVAFGQNCFYDIVSVTINTEFGGASFNTSPSVSC